MNYTINEIPNTATEANDADFAVLYQGDKTKKISFQNLFNKARRNNIFITATNMTIAGPKLQAGDVIRVFFIEQQEGTDTTTAMSLSYNDTSYNVKAPCNGSLKDFTANAITVETRELSKGAETEGEEKGETKSTRATSTAYVYCQAYTTLELLFDGTQFVIIGNPVVISSADYTIYTDGSITYNYNERLKEVSLMPYSTITIDVSSIVICDFCGYYYGGLAKRVCVINGLFGANYSVATIYQDPMGNAITVSINNNVVTITNNSADSFAVIQKIIKSK